MNTLAELNSWSQTVLELQDDRPAGVKFNLPIPDWPKNNTNQIISTTVSVIPAIEITEIINYATANVRFRVRIQTSGSPALTGSTITFGTLPAALTLTTVGSTYTISGINTLDHWDAVKYFTWNLPANYASCPNWYLDIAILYYDGATSQERVVDWEVYDPDNYYIAKLESSASISAIIGNKKPFTSAISSQATLFCPGSKMQLAQASLTASSSMTVAGLDLDLASAAMSVTSTMSITPQGLIRSPGALTFTNSFNQITVDSTVFCINNMTARTYQANNSNQLFATTTPYIADIDPATTATFTIEFTSANGEFGTGSSSSSTLTYSGTLAQCNAYFSGIYFYPTKNYTSNTTFTYRQYKNASLQTTRTVALTYTSTYTIPTEVNTFTADDTFLTTIVQRKYAVMDYLIVGGGGAGGYGTTTAYHGGGGGGGGVTEFTNQTINSSSYAVVVGAAGLRDVSSRGKVGGNGGTSSFNGSTATGGYGGGFSNTVNVGGTGGNSGNGYAGSAGGGGSPATATFGKDYGGAGAGAGGVATDTAYIYDTTDDIIGNGNDVLGWGKTGGIFPGPGYTSSITGASVEYGKGCQGGWATGGDHFAGSRNYGHGGNGSGGPTGTLPTDGGPGVVIVKIHA